MNPKKIIRQTNSHKIRALPKLIKLIILTIIIFIFSIITYTVCHCETILTAWQSFFNPLMINNQNSFPVDRTSEEQIYRAIKISQNNPLNFSQKVSGAVVTHHLLAAYITAQVFENISHQNPKTIIIIGPNHFEMGESKIISGYIDWETPFGMVKSDKQLINKLTNNGIIVNNSVLRNDHSIGAIVPFIGKYIPGAQVLPLIIKRSISEDELSELKNILIKIINKDVVVIASVDFSHYLKSLDAEKNDLITESVIRNFDYRKLLTLGNDYIDSPGSIVLLQMLMSDLGKTEMSVLAHTNSGILTENLDTETTSYFSILFF